MLTARQSMLQSIAQDVTLRRLLLLEYAAVYSTFRLEFPKEAARSDEYWKQWDLIDKGVCSK